MKKLNSNNWKSWLWKGIGLAYWLLSYFNPTLVINWEYVIYFQMASDAIKYSLPAARDSGFFDVDKLEKFMVYFEKLDKGFKVALVLILLLKLLLLYSLLTLFSG
jgi:hypothetical protein